MSYIYCPECGCRQLKIQVTTEARVEFTATDDEDHSLYECPVGDVEWGTDSRTTCTNCGKRGPWSDFRNDDPKKPPLSWR